MHGDLVGFFEPPIPLAELRIHETIWVISLVFFPQEHQGYFFLLHLIEDVIQIWLDSRFSGFYRGINQGQELFVIQIAGPGNIGVLSSF